MSVRVCVTRLLRDSSVNPGKKPARDGRAGTIHRRLIAKINFSDRSQHAVRPRAGLVAGKRRPARAGGLCLERAKPDDWSRACQSTQKRAWGLAAAVRSVRRLRSALVAPPSPMPPNVQHSVNIGRVKTPK